MMNNFKAVTVITLYLGRNLEGNQLSGSLPTELVDRSKAGLLTLRSAFQYLQQDIYAFVLI